MLVSLMQISFIFLPLHGKFIRRLWFYCEITDICEIRTVKIKKKKKLFTPILQKVSSIALYISKNRYSRQVKRKRIENN